MKRFGTPAGRLLAAAALILVIGASLLGAVWAGVFQQVQPALDAKEQVGLNGPLSLAFSCEVDPTSFLERAGFSPEVPGQWTVTGRRAEFRPDEPFEPGAQYQLTLRRGAQCRDTFSRLPGAVIRFSARAPAVVFLGQVTAAPELFLVQADGSGLEQLTETGGMVFDFFATLEGRRIVYSVENENGGADLWSLVPGQGSPQLILTCGAERCVNPALSPDGTTAAYSHQDRTGRSRIWLLSLDRGEPEPIVSDPSVNGEAPRWSSDGQKLSFFDPALPGIRVWERPSGLAAAFPTRIVGPGAWSKDGKLLWYTADDPDAFVPPVFLLEGDPNTGKARGLYAESQGLYEYGLPEAGPDDGWLTIGRRPLEGAAGKQIWLLRLDESDEAAVTDDVTFTHTNYTWAPGGRWLVYQRFKLGSSSSLPEVAVWDRTTGETVVLAEDAAYPAWLP